MLIEMIFSTKRLIILLLLTQISQAGSVFESTVHRRVSQEENDLLMGWTGHCQIAYRGLASSNDDVLEALNIMAKIEQGKIFKALRPQRMAKLDIPDSSPDKCYRIFIHDEISMINSNCFLTEDPSDGLSMSIQQSFRPQENGCTVEDFRKTTCLKDIIESNRLKSMLQNNIREQESICLERYRKSIKSGVKLISSTDLNHIDEILGFIVKDAANITSNQGNFLPHIMEYFMTKKNENESRGMEFDEIYDEYIYIPTRNFSSVFQGTHRNMIHIYRGKMGDIVSKYPDIKEFMNRAGLVSMLFDDQLVREKVRSTFASIQSRYEDTFIRDNMRLASIIATKPQPETQIQIIPPVAPTTEPISMETPVDKARKKVKDPPSIVVSLRKIIADIQSDKRSLYQRNDLKHFKHLTTHFGLETFQRDKDIAEASTNAGSEEAEE